MPSATSWSALGVIMSGLCQPTLCQPRSSTTTWCTAAVQRGARTGAPERSGREAAERRSGAQKSRSRWLAHHDDVRLGVEIRDGRCGGGPDYGEVREEKHAPGLT